MSRTSRSTEATSARSLTGTARHRPLHRRRLGSLLGMAVVAVPGDRVDDGSIAAQGISIASANDCLAIRHSIRIVNVGSETDATCPASCGSISPAVRVTPPSSCQTSDSGWMIESNSRRVRLQSISLSRRSRGGRSGRAAQQRLQAGEHERLLGGQQHLGADRIDVEQHRQRVRRQLALRGGPGELDGIEHLELDRHPQLGGQPGVGGLAERLGRARDPALLVGRELRRAAEVDRPQPMAAALAFGAGCRPRAAGPAWRRRPARRSCPVSGCSLIATPRFRGRPGVRGSRRR